MRKATGRYRRQAASTNNACQPSGEVKRPDPSPPQTAASSKEAKENGEGGSLWDSTERTTCRDEGEYSRHCRCKQTVWTDARRLGRTCDDRRRRRGRAGSSAWDTEARFP